MQIRAAMIPDVAAVIACADLAFALADHGLDDRDDVPNCDLTEQIAEGSIHLICDGARVLGYISSWPIADHLFVDSLAVLPERHGEGLGSRLLAFVESEALLLDLHSVRLFTKAKMTDNVAFYRRRGYRETGRCDDDGYARVFYRKDIPLRASDVTANARRDAR